MTPATPTTEGHPAANDGQDPREPTFDNTAVRARTCSRARRRRLHSAAPTWPAVFSTSASIAAERETAPMDTYEALYTTRAMRRIKPDPIPLDVQQRILDAAVRAPSGGNTQNWRFLVV